ncbi:MAG TPA: hypothetical protein VMW33_09670 [Ilumatobacteraceae bacterium]|nr:hypothetical protein [Ilumatobacteraceae bacterium]
MRADNVLLVAICSAAVIAAATIAWRGRSLPVIAPRDTPTSPSSAAFDALRTLACVLTAGFVAGLLVVGFGGRLVMRALAATSGSSAQGRTTDAGERVGEITLGGSIGFLIFAGLLIPLASSIVFIPLRRVLPRTSWIAGSLLGLLLLATFGVSDPLSPDNVDFVILTPTWLAVTLVCLTAVLFGVTFSAIVARLDATLVPLDQLRSDAPRRRKVPNLSLVWLLIALPLAVPATVYVVGRAILHGRLAPTIDSSPLRLAGYAVVTVGAIAAASAVYAALTDIV